MSKNKNNNGAVLAGVGMICATALGCFYIVYKDNVKLIKELNVPLNRLVDIGDKYIDHVMKREDQENMKE